MRILWVPQREYECKCNSESVLSVDGTCSMLARNKQSAHDL